MSVDNSGRGVRNTRQHMPGAAAVHFIGVYAEIKRARCRRRNQGAPPARHFEILTNGRQPR